MRQARTLPKQTKPRPATASACAAAGRLVARSLLKWHGVTFGGVAAQGVVGTSVIARGCDGMTKINIAPAKRWNCDGTSDDDEEPVSEDDERKETAMKNRETKAVLVTTQHRGVFFGYVSTGAVKVGTDGTITLTNARNCLYWSADVRGFLGLAATGPSGKCRVGPAVPRLTLTGVTSVSEVTPEAETRWTDAPWA